jgi:galactoside 2-L-fucosyltransferase 1/2
MEIHYLPWGQDVKIFSYFRSFKNRLFIKDKIREFYTFKHSVSNEAEKQLKAISEKYTTGVTLVGFHIRRGDYKNRFGTGSKDYPERAMVMYEKNYTSAHFVVCSNDVTWCQREFRDKPNVSVMAHNSVEVDLAILSKCNHNIITMGSFGFWAAYLAGGTVVYYRDYKDPQVLAYLGRRNGLFIAEDVYPPQWIGIDP